VIERGSGKGGIGDWAMGEKERSAAEILIAAIEEGTHLHSPSVPYPVPVPLVG